MSAGDAVGLEEIRRAAEQLSGVVRRTPLEHSRVLAGHTGGEVHLKAENLQRTGSFKVRGAYVRLLGLTAEQRAAGVVPELAGTVSQSSGEIAVSGDVINR